MQSPSIFAAPPPALFAGGAGELVRLSADHPGFHDDLYRRRRNAIAALAAAYSDGAPVPHVEYTEKEHGVWRALWAHLGSLHETYACREYLEATAVVKIARDRIPQLAELNVVLEPLHGFRLLPVAGLVSSRVFLSYLSRGTFLSTQYVRHHATPLYTPEPDVIHELVGHAPTFANADLVRVSRLFGDAAKRAKDDESLLRISRLYWYALEFGLVREGSAMKAVGAGLLSSFGELGRFEKSAELRPFEAATVADTPYDPTRYQSVLFVAPSFAALLEELEGYLTAA